MKHQTILDQMSLEEKVAFCSGADAFRTKAFARHGIPSITMTDGPHGLRVQIGAENPLGLNDSVPATAFPTASLTACSWDRELLFEMAAAIGEEALQEGVSVVLGPGANIKRNPLCGRNFEYFSEDPTLAGELAAAWIRGIQSRGVGASLKHFAANSQESERMSSDSVIDERTLRELYLPAFERAVRAARPATVMCAYNKLNGIYCSDHTILLRAILRDEWGFTGAIVTDWGALKDRVRAFEAGLDLEMPGSNGYFDRAVIEAVRAGELAEERVDESADRLLELVFRAVGNRRPDGRYDAEAHHLLAKKVALNSAVLLKNEDAVLPIKAGQRIALIGALAQAPRYQGAGSSHINPTKLSSAVDGFDELGFEYRYYAGYGLNGMADEGVSAKSVAEAVTGARECDVAVIFAGLPEAYESEGFDRTSLAMPAPHNELIARVAEANPNTVVALVGGAPVEMPWLPQVKAVLNMYLAGQAGGPAAVELLTGRVNPSGKLAESYPLRYEDVPSAGFYETGGKQAQYREGLYVGYRYYDKARQEVLFPFGHGLSYTIFKYEDLSLSRDELGAPYELTVSVTVRNAGDIAGAEVIQVYVRNPATEAHRPEKELKEFAKVWLKPGEAQRVTFTLNARSFAIYDPGARDWVVSGGRYRILAGASSRDIRLQGDVEVRGEDAACAQPGSRWHRNPAGTVTQADFEELLGRKVEPVRRPRKGEYTLDCSFQDMHASFIVRLVMKSIERRIAKSFEGTDKGNPTRKMMLAAAVTMPLRSISLNSPDKMPKRVTTGVVHLANGRYLEGIKSLAGMGES